jgi:hypothetical protein
MAQPAAQLLTRNQALALANQMCSQLPNVTSVPTEIKVEAPMTAPALPAEPFIIDDVYQALLALGPYSLSCLTDRLMDTRWMPDPRSEPLLGVPVVGDVAYMVLTDKGVNDLIPGLAHKKPAAILMDEYFRWPASGNQRQLLQQKVREWISAHPNCCGKPPVLEPTAPAKLKFRKSAGETAALAGRLRRLRPGMKSEAVLKILGKPDAEDIGGGGGGTNLLGFCAGDRNENRAYIYFVERWADNIARRNPLRDRYVIIYFSAENKMTRMFSNVAAIPPIYPSNGAAWRRLMWGEESSKK